jgi:hypothetical protein
LAGNKFAPIPTAVSSSVRILTGFDAKFRDKGSVESAILSVPIPVASVVIALIVACAGFVVTRNCGCAWLNFRSNSSLGRLRLRRLIVGVGVRLIILQFTILTILEAIVLASRTAILETTRSPIWQRGRARSQARNKEGSEMHLEVIFL